MNEDELYLFLALGYAVSPYSSFDIPVAEMGKREICEDAFYLKEWLSEEELDQVMDALAERFHGILDTHKGIYYPGNSVGLIINDNNLLFENERGVKND